MKKIIIPYVFLLSLLFIPLSKCDYSSIAMIDNVIDSNVIKTVPKAVRGSTGWGFFAEFLWAINHLHWCFTHNFTPVIYWGQPFAYFQNTGYNGTYNGWEYYFNSVSNASYKLGEHLFLDIFYPDNNFTAIWNYPQYIQNLHLLINKPENKVIKVSNGKFPQTHSYPVSKHHLYNEEFRHYVKGTIIDKFIHIKKSVTDKLEAFYQKNMAGKRTIGIHLRGKFLGNEVPPISPDFLMYHANLFADGKTQFFIATDQAPLLEVAKKQLRGKVIFYESQRFNSTSSPVAGQAKLHPILGENILIEMLLLSRCDHLIHTLSNVSTTALYFNPVLKHTLLY